MLLKALWIFVTNIIANVVADYMEIIWDIILMNHCSESGGIDLQFWNTPVNSITFFDFAPYNIRKTSGRTTVNGRRTSFGYTNSLDKVVSDIGLTNYDVLHSNTDKNEYTNQPPSVSS